ncbi:MAG: pyridoxamine 5'-phosphate oxidase [Sphingomonadales bacterium]
MKQTSFSVPFKLFGKWFKRAQGSEPDFPNAFAVATTTKAGAPSVRMVLMKDWGEDGFVFYTNLESRKGLELAENPQAAMLFHWKSQGRQIRIEGVIEPVSAAEANAYYTTRPRSAQLGAWASDQSRTMTGRHELKMRLAKFTTRFRKIAVERPPYWSGYRLKPTYFEFWQNRRSRLHEREVYKLNKDGTWTKEYLFP